MPKSDAYKNLYTYLKGNQNIEVVLTLEEIEKIINRTIPSARPIRFREK